MEAFIFSNNLSRFSKFSGLLKLFFSVLITFASLPAFSLVVFEDTFDAEAQGLGRISGLAKWTVTAGDVDVIGTGLDDRYPGNGNYLDLEGCRNGTIVSPSLQLQPGTYLLTFQLGKNYPDLDTNGTHVSLGSVLSKHYYAPKDHVSGSTLINISESFIVYETVTVNLSFQEIGVVNCQGSILDDISLQQVKAAAFTDVVIESFNDDRTVLNTILLRNWDVTLGNVDVLGPGLLDFYPNNGNYLDLEGCANGRIELKNSLNLSPGNYELSFELGKNTPDEDRNGVDVSLGSLLNKFYYAPVALTPIRENINLPESAIAKLGFQENGLSGNCRGTILDDVLLRKRALMPVDGSNFTDLLLGPTSPHLQLNNHYTYDSASQGLLRTFSSGNTNRPLNKTVASNFFANKYWTFEIEVKATLDDGIFVGFGPATSNLNFGNEPSNAFLFRIIATKTNGYQVQAAAMDGNTAGNPFRSLVELGTEPPLSKKLRLMIQRQGDQLTFLSPGSSRLVSHTFSISALASSLSMDSTSLSHLFFGNTAEGTVFSNVVVRSPDTTPPDITITHPLDGASYNLGQQVDATPIYSCVDDRDGTIASNTEACKASLASISTAIGGTFKFTVTATDSVGNTSSLTHTYKVIDLVKPTITIRTPAINQVFFKNATTQTFFFVADFDCTDSGQDLTSKAIATANGRAVTDNSNVDLVAAGENLAFTVTCTDGSGNTTTVTHSYSVRVDSTPPVCRLLDAKQDPNTLPLFVRDGDKLLPKSIAFILFQCTDEAGGSGLKSSFARQTNLGTLDTQDIPLNTSLNTAVVGSFSYVASGFDNVNNLGTATRKFDVIQRLLQGGTFRQGGLDIKYFGTGSLFMSDSVNNQILETNILVSPTPHPMSITGAPLNRPTGIAVTLSHDLVVANAGSNELIFVNNQTKTAAVLLTAANGLLNPGDLAVTAFDHIIIANNGLNQILEYDRGSGTLTKLADGSHGLTSVGGITVDSFDNILVTNPGTNEIFEINRNSGMVQVLLSSAHGLSSPADIDIQPNGNIVIANSGTHQILEWDILSRSMKVIAGTGVPGVGADYELATQSPLNSPQAVEVDNEGHLFIGDTGNRSVVWVAGPDKPAAGSDITGPTIALAAPFNVDGYDIARLEANTAKTTIGYSCADAGSGVAACSMTVVGPDGRELFRTLDPSLASGSFITPAELIGTYSIKVIAVDIAGNRAFARGHYNVVYDFDPNNFLGSNFPKKPIHAGKMTMVRFNIGGNFGLGIFSQDPDSQQIDCATGASLSVFAPATLGKFEMDGTRDQIRADGLLALSLTDLQYKFKWQTDKAFVGSCRKLRLHLNDGSTPTTTIEFKSTL